MRSASTAAAATLAATPAAAPAAAVTWLLTGALNLRLAAAPAGLHDNVEFHHGKLGFAADDLAHNFTQGHHGDLNI